MGEVFNIFVNVNNDGPADASNVSPTARLRVGRYGVISSGAPAPVKIAGPIPASDVIPSTASADFTFSFSAQGTGAFQFGSHALGTASSSPTLYYADENVSSTGKLSATYTFVTPANLSITSLTASSALVNVGQILTVTMVVADIGQDTANAVLPTLIPVQGPGAALANASSPVAAILQGVGLGAGAFPTATFQWTYTVNGAGTVNFSGLAFGVDFNNANHGVTLTVQSSPALSSVVQINNPAQLSASFAQIPSSVDRSQVFTVVLSVTDTAFSGSRRGSMSAPTPISSSRRPLWSAPSPGRFRPW